MIRFLVGFLSLASFLFSSNLALACNSDHLTVEIRTYPKPGNGESICAKNDSNTFISVNGHSISFYSVTFQKECQDAERYGDLLKKNNGVFRACLPKRILTDNINTFVFDITNTSPSTYVNVQHDVILSPGTLRELFLWQGITRVGTYPNHSFHGQKEKNFSTLVLTTQNGHAIIKVQNAINAIITNARELLDRHSREYQELLELEESLKDLFKNGLEIDIDSLNAPQWFKDALSNTLANYKQIKKTLETRLSSLEKEAQTLAQEAKNVLSEFDIALDQVNLANCNLEEIQLKDCEEKKEEIDPNDNEFSQYADEIISRLTSLWRQEDRVGFIEVFYAWQENHTRLAPIINSRIGFAPGEWEAFQLSHNRIMHTVRQYMDERLYFHSSQVPESVKDAIDIVINKRSPAIAREIKTAVNTLKQNNAKTQMAFTSIEELALGYQESPENEKPFWDKLAHGLSFHIKQIASAVDATMECAVKSVGAGPFAELYELRFNKSFCTNEELDSIDLIVSASSLSISAAGLILGPGGGAAGNALGKGMSFVKSLFGRVFKPLNKGKVAKAFEIVDSLNSHKINLTKIDRVRFKKNPLKDTKYTNKVKMQILQSEDKFHSFPHQVDNFAGMGKQTKVTGGDGITRTKIEVEGEYLGRKGNFEWIVEPDGFVNHRKFEPF